jgi:hypothetical protein
MRHSLTALLMASTAALANPDATTQAKALVVHHGDAWDAGPLSEQPACVLERDGQVRVVFAHSEVPALGRVVVVAQAAVTLEPSAVRTHTACGTEPLGKRGIGGSFGPDIPAVRASVLHSEPSELQPALQAHADRLGWCATEVNLALDLPRPDRVLALEFTVTKGVITTVTAQAQTHPSLLPCMQRCFEGPVARGSFISKVRLQLDTVPLQP